MRQYLLPFKQLCVKASTGEGVDGEVLEGINRLYDDNVNYKKA